MLRRSTVRSMIALGVALSTLVVAAQPVAAARILKETGSPAYYELYDEQVGRRGANCIYEAGSYDLDKITIRPPQMHGNHQQNTKVEWRFRIRRQRLTPGATFKTIFTSTWQADQANDAVPADDFTRRNWLAPEEPQRPLPGARRAALLVPGQRRGLRQGAVRVVQGQMDESELHQQRVLLAALLIRLS